MKNELKKVELLMKLNLLKYEDLKKLVELVFPNLISKEEKDGQDKQNRN